MLQVKGEPRLKQGYIEHAVRLYANLTLPEKIAPLNIIYRCFLQKCQPPHGAGVGAGNAVVRRRGLTGRCR